MIETTSGERADAEALAPRRSARLRTRPRRSRPRVGRVGVAGALVAALVASVSGCSAAPAIAPLFLFSVESEGAHIVTHETDDGERELLVLPEVELVTWFTDRPVRLAGGLSLTDFVNDWDANGFAADPPDAALTVITPDGTERTHVVRILGAEVTPGGVELEVEDLVDSDPDAQAAGRDASHQVETGEMAHIALFVEGAADCGRCQAQVAS